MPQFDPSWVDAFIREHGYAPSYDDYEASQVKQSNPDLSWEQIWYINHPGQAPRDYWGKPQTSSAVGGGPPSTPEYKPLPQVTNWDEWTTVYGSQPSEVDKMPDALKAMQEGAGAQSLWGKYVDVAMADATGFQKEQLKKRFLGEFDKYREESGRAAQAGAEPVSWHGYLTKKGQEGASKDFEYLTPEERGERQWGFGTRGRYQWR